MIDKLILIGLGQVIVWNIVFDSRSVDEKESRYLVVWNWQDVDSGIAAFLAPVSLKPASSGLLTCWTLGGLALLVSLSLTEAFWALESWALWEVLLVRGA